MYVRGELEHYTTLMEEVGTFMEVNVVLTGEVAALHLGGDRSIMELFGTPWKAETRMLKTVALKEEIELFMEEIIELVGEIGLLKLKKKYHHYTSCPYHTQARTNGGTAPTENQLYFQHFQILTMLVVKEAASPCSSCWSIGYVHTIRYDTMPDLKKKII